MADRSRFTGWVYFIRSPGNGLIKIGWTAEHPDKRLAGLRASSPVELRPMAVIRSRARYREGFLHREFAQHRTHFEWFRPGDDLLAYIAKRGRPWPAPTRAIVAERLATIPAGDKRAFIAALLARHKPRPEIDRSNWHPDVLAMVEENGRVLAWETTPADVAFLESLLVDSPEADPSMTAPESWPRPGARGRRSYLPPSTIYQK